MRRRTAVAFLSALVAGGILLASGCGSVGHTTEGDTALGRELFTQKCASCHVLAAAGARGTIGPNLDEAFDDVVQQDFDESTILDVVRDQIAYPVSNPPTEATAGMPPQDELFPKCEEGEDPEESGCFEDPDEAADAVAAYVASVAGRPVAGGGTDGGVPPGTTDGKEIFAAAGCGSCHTFGAAGTNGTIGPNLDEAQPTLELAIDRVTNGQGAMPSFKGQLTEEQIRAVAEFVSGGG